MSWLKELLIRFQNLFRYFVFKMYPYILGDVKLIMKKKKLICCPVVFRDIWENLFWFVFWLIISNKENLYVFKKFHQLIFYKSCKMNSFDLLNFMFAK